MGWEAFRFDQIDVNGYAADVAYSTLTADDFNAVLSTFTVSGTLQYGCPQPSRWVKWPLTRDLLPVAEHVHARRKTLGRALRRMHGQGYPNVRVRRARDRGWVAVWRDARELWPKSDSAGV
jgi:hypothetical protein